MADKPADEPEFVDMIREATRQSYRRTMPHISVLPTTTKETSRLGHWPPERLTRWRLETLAPWKIKPWKANDWD